MEIKESRSIMEGKGYEILFHSADYKMVDLVKHIDKLDMSIHAKIIDGEDMVQLSSMVGLFTINSGKFSITHHRFKELFEDKLISLTYKTSL